MNKIKRWLKKWFCVIVIVIIVIVAFVVHPWWYGGEKQCSHIDEVKVEKIELVVPDVVEPAVEVPETDSVN